MESIGQLLKQQRDVKSLSLDDVQSATKITVQNLSALEEDRFDSFPNRVYARAFLRDYANYLGLDSADLVARYEEQYHPAREPEETVPKGRPVWAGIGYCLLAVIILVGLGTVGYLGWRAYERSYSVPEPDSQAVVHQVDGDDFSSPPDQSTHPVDTQTGEEVQPGDEAQPEEKPEPEQAKLPDKLALQVSAFRDVWIRVKSDGQTQFAGILPKGETRVVEGKESVSIRAGMAGAVQLKINGKLLEPMGTVKEVGERTFTLEELRAAASQQDPALAPNSN